MTLLKDYEKAIPIQIAQKISIIKERAKLFQRSLEK